MSLRRGVWILLSLAWLVNCGGPLPLEEPVLETEGQVVLYLQPWPQAAQNLQVAIEGIDAVREDGARFPLAPMLSDLDGKYLIGRQKQLAVGNLPAGSYNAISLKIKSAAVAGEDGTNALLTAKEPVVVGRLYQVVRREATALFLSLDRSGLAGGSVVFAPVFSLAAAGRQLINLTGYVSIAATNRLTVFNKSTMQVTDVIATGHQPSGLVIDPLGRRAYVACTGADRIEEIDLLENRVVGRIHLRFGDGPLELAVSPDGRTLVSANHLSDTASIVDLGSRVERARVRVGRRPTAVTIDSAGTRAFVVNSLSDTVSVVDLQQEVRVADVGVEANPLRAALEPRSGGLFVINRNSPNLSLIDTERMTVTDSIFVRPGALSIVADPLTRLLYVGNDIGDILVIDSSALMYVDSIPSAGQVVYLAIDDEQNSLYAVQSGRDTLVKINLTSKRVLSELEVEKGAYAVAVVGAR